MIVRGVASGVNAEGGLEPVTAGATGAPRRRSCVAPARCRLKIGRRRPRQDHVLGIDGISR
jgi:hypothetical protein